MQQGSASTLGLHPPLAAGPALHFAWLDLSVADLIVVALMIIIFILAIIIPFPESHS